MSSGMSLRSSYVTLIRSGHRRSTLLPMTRTRIGLAMGTLVIGAAALVGLTACDRGAAVASPAEVVSDTAVSAEMQALTALGFDTTGAPIVTDPAPAPSTDAGAPGGGAPGAKASKAPRAGVKGIRRYLRKNTLHGEFVVRTKDGTKTVDVQRGTVTAIDTRTVTVKSTDGFTLTWTFGNPINVLEHRTTVQPSAVKVGTEIGVAGTKDGSTTSARLIVIR
jgi:hypothetical protein